MRMRAFFIFLIILPYLLGFFSSKFSAFKFYKDMFLFIACDSVHCQALVKPPMMPGEVARIVKTADGCCDKYEVMCKPETCTIQPHTCTPPQLMKNVNPGECCPTFRCGRYLSGQNERERERW